MKLLGLDIGGTHVTCATVEPRGDGYAVGPPQRTDVDSSADADAILNAWVTAIRSMADPADLTAIGFAMPGPFDYPRGISLIRGVAKYESLYGLNVMDALRTRLVLPHDRPMVFENDCNAFVLGEWLAGAGVGHRRVIGFTLGTGFGSGFLDNGRIVPERDDLPPDTTLGFVPYRDGIAEDCVSRRGLRKRYAAAGGDPDLDVADIARLALAGDRRARELFDELGRMLAEILAPYVASFAADAVIIGGAISRSYGLFRDALADGLPRCATVSVATLPETAGLLGAAALARRQWTNGRQASAG